MIRIIAILTVGSFLGAGSLKTLAERGPLPVRIELYPRNIVLEGRAARQRLVVNATFPDGRIKDVSASARLSVSSPAVVLSAEAVVRGRADGVSRVTAALGRLTTFASVVTKNQKRPVTWSFENHVEPVLSKQGCNMGPCHGATAGKGGFRLTLRAYDPDLDYERIVKEARGRRIVRSAPMESLLLKKPSLAAPHVGGLRLRRDSDEYRILTEWIASGSPGPNPREAKVTEIDVYPKDRTLAAGDRQPLLVTARYSDGRSEDVTHWAKFTSSDEPVAKVDTSGRVEMRGSGESAVSVWYQGKVAFSRLRVPFPNRVDSAAYDRMPRANFVDGLVQARLRTLRLLPSGPASDGEFLRRIYLDVLGILPTPAETRAFLSDNTPGKRATLIRRILDREEYVDLATYRLGDLFRVNRDLLAGKGMWSFQTWLRESLASNKPWDKLAYEILTAGGANGPAAFYRAGKTAEEYSETFSQVFLGIRVQCAKCHNHPFEKWTQSDYFRMANFFARVGRKELSGGTPVYFSAAGGEVDHPKLGRPLPPRPFDGPELALDSRRDRRQFLADWLVSPRNPYFARNIVNRVWKQYMGRGLVEPADDMRLTNPATNEPLLDALTRDFVKNGFDLKRLAAVILNSAAYQASSTPNATNAADDRFYSRYLVRRLPAETLLDAISQVTEQPEKFPGIPKGARAISLPDTNISSGFLDLFGRPVRQVTCDCERSAEPSVAQALHLINAQTFNQKVAANGGLLDRLLASGKGDRSIVEELYLTCFSRPPSPAESTRILKSLAAPSKDQKWQIANRKSIFSDLLWALLATPEFLFNH